MENNPVAKGEWRSGLFGCCDEGAGNCCYGFLCPPCAGARARSDYDGSNCCFNACCVGLAGSYNIVREGNAIEGDCCGDVLKAVWCPCCSAAQLLNQPTEQHEGKKSVTRQWSHGFCDCFAAGPGVFCATFFCQCIPCLTASARRNFDSSNWCFNCLCLTPCANYNIVREGSGIEGTWLTDVLKMTCLPCCATIQMHSEVPH